MPRAWNNTRTCPYGLACNSYHNGCGGITLILNREVVVLKVYRTGSELIHITNRSPRQFQDVLFLCFRGTSPESVEEGVIAPAQFQGWEEVDIETLSPEWRQALNLPAATASKTVTVPVASKSAVGRRHKPLQSRRTKRKRTRRPSSPPEESWGDLWRFAMPWLVALTAVGGIGLLIAFVILMGQVADYFWDWTELGLNRKCPS